MSILIIIGICFLLVSGFLDSENKTTFKKVLGDFLYGLGCVLCGFGLFYYIVKDSPIEIKTHNDPEKIIKIDTLNDTTFKINIYLENE